MRTGKKNGGISKILPIGKGTIKKKTQNFKNYIASLKTLRWKLLQTAAFFCLFWFFFFVTIPVKETILTSSNFGFHVWLSIAKPMEQMSFQLILPMLWDPLLAEDPLHSGSE